MQPFTRHCGVAAPLEGRNVDTDQIVPARFLKSDRSAGYGRFLFHDLRRDEAGAERRDFVLNREPFREATILVADENFGCGSSREGAVYALADGGIRAVIAPSFGDIFYNNCLKNGIVPVALPVEAVTDLRRRLAGDPGRAVCVDLDLLTIDDSGGEAHGFAIDPFWRECLMKGVDEIELTLQYTDRIEAFEAEYRREMPWTVV